MSRKFPTEAQQFISRRRVARKLALIGIYQWLITGNEFQEIYQNFQQDVELAKDFRKADAAFFHQLMRSTIDKREQIEAELEPHLDRKLAQVDPIESAALRLGVCELMDNPESPYKVVVNEAVSLSKKFGGEQAHKFVNGVLDKVAAKLRPIELQAERGESQS